MSATWTDQRLSNWFVSALADQLTQALRKGPGASKFGSAELVPGEPRDDVWKAWTDPVWYAVQAEIKQGATLFIGCARDTALQLGGAEPGDESGTAATALTAYEQLLNEAVTVVDAVVEQKTGKPAQFHAFHSDGHPSFASLGLEYRFHLGEATHLLALAPSPALLDSVILAKLAGLGEVKIEGAGAMGTGHLANQSELSPAAAENLRLLMDVDLDLSISFGKTRLLLNDVLKLASGAVVELNRSANDAVDVLVNNSIVARGEVVVIDGNYGVRVTEVVSQTALMRSVM